MKPNDNSYQLTTYRIEKPTTFIKRQRISGDNWYQLDVYETSRFVQRSLIDIKYSSVVYVLALSANSSKKYS